jgi:hypothetical protein
MTTPRRKKDVCSTCGTMAGVLSCRGCTGHFCVPHSKEHRELLQRSMNEITHNYDELKKKIQRQTSEQQQHSLAEQIDQWEQESIEKIRQLANDTRQEIKTTVQHRTDHLKEKLEKLKQQLDKARRDGGFYENDLKQWSDKLQELQRSFIDQPKIKLDEDSLSTPLVSRISLNETSRILLSSSSSSLFPTDSEHETAQYQNYLPHKDYDEPSNQRQDDYHPNNASHKDYDHFSNQNEVPQRDYEDFSTQHEQETYSSGKHELRFKIEESEKYTSVLFGIISESEIEYPDSEKNPTFYGWAEKNLVYLGGITKQNYQQYQSDFQTGDPYVLIIDCDKRRISLTNERIDRSYYLEIDLNKCPFPWQVNARMISHD